VYCVLCMKVVAVVSTFILSLTRSVTPLFLVDHRAIEWWTDD
jgi:hypothetical protein